VICNTDADVYRITLQCRVNVSVLRDIFIPEDVRSCQQHLDDQDFFLQALLPDNCGPYIIKGPFCKNFKMWQGIKEDSLIRTVLQMLSFNPFPR